jgi:hypothetical protein
MFQPDELVLARMGTTYWPGKILGPSDNNKYKVYFYGDYKT